MAYLFRSTHPEQASKFLNFLWENVRTVCYLGCPFHDSDADACLADLPQPCLELGWLLAHFKVVKVEA